MKAPIKRLYLDALNVGLDLWMDTIGCQSQEIIHLQQTCDKIASKLNVGTISSTELWVFYSSIFIPKVYYLCNLTMFRSEEWENISRKNMHALLCKMGSMDMSIVYGPGRLGELVRSRGMQNKELIAFFIS